MKPVHAFLLATAAIVATPLTHAGDETYRYDALGRLAVVSFDTGATITYIYDTNGNLARRTKTVLVDTDADRLDDRWEQANFASLANDGAADSDGDGRSDRDEFVAGTDPRDAGSFLRSESVSRADGGGVTVTWSTVPGKAYRLEFTDDLASGIWSALPGTFTATAATTSTTDPTSPPPPSRLYRLVTSN